MGLFKSVDEKFEEIGFIKTNEDTLYVVYERKDEKHKFTQCLYLAHRHNGRHTIQSYDPLLMDEKRIGNTCVGLTMYEAKLCIKKMKEKGWRIIK